jgi:urease accessory protein
MLIVNKIIPQAQGLAAALLRRASQVELSWDLRQKSRFDALDSSGRQLGFMLPRGTVLRGGDVAVVEDGSLVRVLAAGQAVLVVRTCPEHGTPRDLLRAAYHLANRHVPLELQADHLKLEPDHVLADMLRAMHLIVQEEQGAFEPEAGAYAAGGAGHAHGHDHGDHHDHAEAAHHHAPPAPAGARPVSIPVRAAPVPHVHGPGCGHGHGDHDH